MAPKKYRSRWYINALIILIIVALLRTQSARISRTYGDDLVGVKNTIATQLQRSWKFLVDAFTPAPDMDALPDASLTPNNE